MFEILVTHQSTLLSLRMPYLGVPFSQIWNSREFRESFGSFIACIATQRIHRIANPFALIMQIGHPPLAGLFVPLRCAGTKYADCENTRGQPIDAGHAAKRSDQVAIRSFQEQLNQLTLF